MDQRKAHTRQALLDAFGRLATVKRYENISTAAIVQEARVGRSTFYEHFTDKDALLLASLEPLLLPLAHAASGRASKAMLRVLLIHVWDRRSRFRSILSSPAERKIAARLAAIIEERLDFSEPQHADHKIFSIAAAHGQIATLRAWVSGEISANAESLARALRAVRFANLP